MIVGETSEAQKEKVKGLEKAEKVRKRAEKDRRGVQKAGRRGEWD